MDSEIHIAEYILKCDKNLIYPEITFIFNQKYYVFKFYETTWQWIQYKISLVLYTDSQ